jgi:hypothetical protein
MTLFHVTTEKKAKGYRATGYIQSPVRGFKTMKAAMAWAIKVGRKVIYKIDCDRNGIYKLPDHHNRFGEAWWIDSDVPVDMISCVFSADKDA